MTLEIFEIVLISTIGIFSNSWRYCNRDTV